MKNLWSKSIDYRKAKTDAYLIVTSSSFPGWTWYVLKAYQSRSAERKNEYARWFCLVTSPMTGELGDLGDTYISDIPIGPEHRRVLDARELSEAENSLAPKKKATIEEVKPPSKSPAVTSKPKVLTKGELPQQSLYQDEKYLLIRESRGKYSINISKVLRLEPDPGYPEILSITIKDFDDDWFFFIRELPKELVDILFKDFKAN